MAFEEEKQPLFVLACLRRKGGLSRGGGSAAVGLALPGLAGGFRWSWDPCCHISFFERPFSR